MSAFVVFLLVWFLPPVLGVTLPAAQAIVRPLTLDELSVGSAAAVTGSVLSTSSRWKKEAGALEWSRGTIVTDVRLRIDDVLNDLGGASTAGGAGGLSRLVSNGVLAGLPGVRAFAGTFGVAGTPMSLDPGRTVTITVPGGAVGDWTVMVEDAAAFAPGSDYVVFLDARGGVAGWRQGNPLVVDGWVPAFGLSLEDLEQRVDAVTQQAARLRERLLAPAALLWAAQAGDLLLGGLQAAAGDGGQLAGVLGGSTLLGDTGRLLSGARGLVAEWAGAPALTEALVKVGALEPLELRGIGEAAGPQLTFALPAPAPQQSGAGSPRTRGPAPDPYPAGVKAWMVQGPFDLSGSAESQLSFRAWYSLAIGLDRCVAALSLDGREFTGYALSGRSDGWQSYRLRLDDWPLLGDVRARSKVWVGFLFESDGIGTDEGAYVDDVALAGSVFRDGFERPPYSLGGAWRVYDSPTWGVATYRAASGAGSAYCVGGGPRIAAVDPGRQAAGIDARVTIQGSGFGARQGSGGVRFFYQEGEPNIPAPVVSWSDRRIVCRVPIGIVNRYPGSAGSGPLTVTTAGGGAAAHAFSVTYGWGRAWWPSGRTVFRVKAPPEFARAVRAAAAVWNQSGSPFRFVDGGAAPSDEIALDFHNDVVWKMVEEPGVIAYARYSSFRGNVVEVDQVFNTQFSWGDGSNDTMDVQTISVHEMGHWLNLRDLYGRGDTDKCMYGFGDTGQKKRSLHDGDREGILWVYRHAPFDEAPPSTAARPLSVRSGETATLRLRVDDPAPSCGWAMVRVRIRDAGGEWVRSSSVIDRRTNEWSTYSFRCRLPAGRYSVHVFARDMALHEQTEVGTAALVVE